MASGAVASRLPANLPAGVAAILTDTLRQPPGSLNTDWFGTLLVQGMIEWGRRGIPEALDFARNWLACHLGPGGVAPFSGPHDSRLVRAGGITITTYSGHFGLALPCYEIARQFADARARQVCLDIGIQIGGNYARNNYTEFPKLLDYLACEGLTPDIIKGVKFDPVTAANKSFTIRYYADWCMSINEQWVIEASLLLREAIMKRGFRTPLIKSYRCMIEGQNYFAVNYNGDLYKCPGFIGREAFKIGTLKEGFKRYDDIYGLDIWKNEQCLSCSYLPLCFGGCRYMRLIAKGDVAGVDCRKDYYDASLKAFVLQDIEFRHR